MSKMAEEDKQNEKKAEIDGLIEEAKKLDRQSAAQTIPILRLTRSYNKPGKPKNYKLKVFVKTKGNSTVPSVLHTLFGSHGGVKKVGVAPRGATVRQVEVVLKALEEVDNTVWW